MAVRKLRLLCGGMLHTLTVQVRTESNDMSVFCCIGFHAFEYSLCILENTGTFIQYYIRVCGQFSFIPFAILEVGNITIICRDIAESYAAPVNVLFFHNIYSSISYGCHCYCSFCLQ